MPYFQPDTVWRNRDVFLKGREAVVGFLTRKWQKENGYRLRKELFAFTDNKIAVQVRGYSHSQTALRHHISRASARHKLTRHRPGQFFYEWYEVKPDGSKQWYRCYGLEACTSPVSIVFFTQRSWDCCRTGPLPRTVS